MAYTIDVTTNLYTVTSISTSTNVVVNAPATPVFTITNQISNFTITNTVNTVTMYSNAVELLVDDFANYFKQNWQSGATYRRGQLVNYEYSLYVCSTGTYSTVISTVAPVFDSNWTRVVWNEAPRDHLTVTNHLSAGSLSVGGVDGDGLTINSTSTFNGDIYMNGSILSGIRVFGTSTFYGPVNFSTTVSGIVSEIYAGPGIEVNTGTGYVTVSSKSKDFFTGTNHYIRAGMDTTSTAVTIRNMWNGNPNTPVTTATHTASYSFDNIFVTTQTFQLFNDLQDRLILNHDCLGTGDVPLFKTTYNPNDYYPRDLPIAEVYIIPYDHPNDRFPLINVIDYEYYSNLSVTVKNVFYISGDSIIPRFQAIYGRDYSSQDTFVITSAALIKINLDESSISIGNNIGQLNAGENSIYIGKHAGFTNLNSQTVVINATGQVIPPEFGLDSNRHPLGVPSGTYIAPLNNTNTNYAVYYNPSTYEMTYSNALNLNFGRIVN